MCPLSTLLVLGSKIISAYQHPLFPSSSLLCRFLLLLSSFLLLPLSLPLSLFFWPPVRDDYFGKAGLASAPILTSFPGLLLSHPHGSLPLCLLFCGFIFAFCIMKKRQKKKDYFRECSCRVEEATH